MEPSFKTISDLFAVAQPTDLMVQENTRKKQGESFQESQELGQQSINDGDFQAAIKHFRDAVDQRDPDDVTSLINLAGAFEYGDQYPQAFRQFEQALRIKGDAVEPHIGLSDLYRRYGRFKDAIEELEVSIQKEPKNSYLRIKLAEALRDAGLKSRALAAAREAILVTPDDPFNHYWIGDLLIQMERFEEALDSLRAAIELSPGDDFLYLRVSIAFWGAGRRAEAVKSVRLASDLDPEKSLYHGLLESFLDEMGLDAEADLETERANEMDRYDQERLRRLLIEAKIEA